jgi:hypothetical protein
VAGVSTTFSLNSPLQTAEQSRNRSLEEIRPWGTKSECVFIGQKLQQQSVTSFARKPALERCVIAIMAETMSVRKSAIFRKLASLTETAYSFRTLHFTLPAKILSRSGTPQTTIQYLMAYGNRRNSKHGTKNKIQEDKMLHITTRSPIILMAIRLMSFQDNTWGC